MNKMNQSVEEQIKIITKGVENIYNEHELRNKIRNAIQKQKPLNIKLGLDPSAPDIHIGHAVVLRKIKQMQELGHRAIIIIGDFTGKIGDPTGKKKGRQALDDKKVKENALTYQKQIFKILDPEKTEVRFNSEWLSDLKFNDVISLAMTSTVARMLERDDFQNRYKNGEPIGLHEFFYPLMQAYDSIAVDADIELGGTDQTFNILMGRTLQKAFGKEQQIAMFMPILEGLDGVEKMSKSLNNYIGVEEEAHVMFKKAMEIPDHFILKYFLLATDEHPDDIEQMKQRLEAGENPRDIKFELAKIITGLYHTKKETEKAIQFYQDAFQKKSVPEEIPELLIDWQKDKIKDVIPQFVQMNFVASNSEFRRLLLQGGIKINNETIDDLEQVLVNGDVLKIGKKTFLKIIK